MNDDIRQREANLQCIMDQIWKLVATIREEQDGGIKKEDELKLLKIEDAICSALNLPERG